MTRKYKTIALIVAGGRGTRMGNPVPKSYLPLAGKPVIRRTAEVFLYHPGIDAVQVVIHPDDIEHYQKACGDLELLPPVIGGATRQQSVYLGLQAIAALHPEQVLIHDAARPRISAAVINTVLIGLAKHPAVIPTIPVADTVKKVGYEGRIIETIDRSQLQLAQTPQGFHFPLIYDLHQRAEGMEFTDDAALLEDFGVASYAVLGESTNRKLTTPEDYATMEALMTQSITRVGQGFDVHAFEPGDHVMLCGVKVPHYSKLSGHSDADVGLHALVDAILGALGEGDIGEHFLPSDKKWKGADSAKFVTHSLALCRKHRATINNVDITLICEEPKLWDYKPLMRTRVAALLEIPESVVNIKATTTEKLGFTGRKEGIAAQAVVCMQVPA